MNKNIEEMINSGEMSVMTECAYGEAIGDSEMNNTLNKKIKKDNGSDKDINE